MLSLKKRGPPKWIATARGPVNQIIGESGVLVLKAEKNGPSGSIFAGKAEFGLSATHRPVGGDQEDPQADEDAARHE